MVVGILRRTRGWWDTALGTLRWQTVRASVDVVRFRPRQLDLTLACGAHQQGAAAPVARWLVERRHHPGVVGLARLPHAALRAVAAQAARWFGPTASAVVRWLGGAVAGAADAVSAGALQRSLSLRANPGWLVPHSHVVAVLALDMRGFSVLTRELRDTQYLADLIGEYLTALTAVVERHRGVVFDYTGDGLLALFLPESLGCDPPAMLDHLTGRVAPELHAAFRVVYARWSSEWHASGLEHVPVGLGSGLDFGPSTIGFLGASGKKHFGVVGEAVNMAAYLCSQAQAGTLLLDRQAYARVGGTPPGGRTRRLRSKKPHEWIEAVCIAFPPEALLAEGGRRPREEEPPEPPDPQTSGRASTK